MNSIEEDPFADVKGKYQLRIEIKTPGDEDYEEVIVPSGAKWSTAGESLRELRARLGGDEGLIVNDYTGEKHAISIAHLQGADPDATRCYVVYEFMPDPTDMDNYQEASRRLIDG
jgi:hypothetical protein